MTRETYIKQLIKESGYNLKDFAKSIDMPYSTLLSIVNNSLGGAAIDNVLKICAKLGITADSLSTNSIDKLSDSFTDIEKHHIKKYRSLDDYGKELIDIVLEKEYTRSFETKDDENEKILLRVYDESAAAGFGNYLSEDSSYSEIEFLSSEVPEGTDYGVHISGDSMEPEIHDGSIAFVKAENEIDSGEIGIFVIDGDAFCKRLFVDYDYKEIILVSENEKYDDIVINEYMNFRTVGQVLGSI